MPGWHRADIIAALHKLGTTLEELGARNGKGRTSMSAALIKPSRGCNLIIANKIGVPAHELWPAWFDADGKSLPGIRARRDGAKAIRRNRRVSSQKRGRDLRLTGSRA
jgi:Ner family transcriptional regulator